MTEVVTSDAASQLNLLADRQPGFSVEHDPAVGAGVQVAPQGAPAINKPERVATSHSSDEHSARERQQVRAAPSSPSKARIELKRIDFGLTPAEVVGTVDVLQRFDDNGDGRVDLLESHQAQLSRHDGFTFAGLAASPTKLVQRSFVPSTQASVGPQLVPAANPD